MKYVDRIKLMCSSNKETLEMNWQDLWGKEPTIAEWIGRRFILQVIIKLHKTSI
jgi:hypothetical protein